MVDRLLVEFGNRLPPLSFNVTDAKVKRVKFEMRIINKVQSCDSTYRSHVLRYIFNFIYFTKIRTLK